MNHDWLNGYNNCVEKIIDLLNQEIVASKSGDDSVNDVMRRVRKHVLDSSFVLLTNFKNTQL